MSLLKRYQKILIPLIVLVGALSAFGVLKATKPQAPLNEVAERFWPIEVAEVSFADIRPTLRRFGEIRAGREAELRAQVSGTVIEVHEKLGDGALVRTGDILVRIDDFDYLATRDERQAELAEAQARLEELETVLSSEEKLLPLEQNQVNLAQSEVNRQQRLLKSSAGRKKAYDDSRAALNDRKQNVLLREQAITRLTSQIVQAQSARDKALTALTTAERDVEDTRLKAPFDGFLTDTDVTAGKQVSTSDRLGRLISLDRLEVSFHVSEADFARLSRVDELIGRPVEVRLQRGADEKSFGAEVVRIDARVDATTGGRNVFAAFSGLNLATDLRPGLFVEVLIPDAIYANSISLPQEALHEDSIVYVVEGERLKKRSVTLAVRNENHVIVSAGLEAGDKVALTRFAEIGDGVKVLVK